MDDAFLEDLEYCTQYSPEEFEKLSASKKLRIVVSRLFSNLA